MDGACSTNEKTTDTYKMLAENLKGKDHPGIQLFMAGRHQMVT
jgi:hypothetical protein